MIGLIQGVTGLGLTSSTFAYVGKSPPVAQDDAVTTNEDTVLTGSVLADNGDGADSDPNNDPLSVTTVNSNTGDVGQEITLASGAKLTLNADGTFNYNPSANFNGNDSFTYTISDGNSTNTATVNVSVTPVSDISINNVTVNEGNVGTTNASFSVTLDQASSGSVSVNFATANGSGNNSATAPADYTAANGTLTFNPGDTSEAITVAINGDLVDEANETFFVNLSNPTNATIADAQGQGMITDDDLANDGAGAQKTFVINQGSGTTTITNFGGVGTGNTPSQAEIAEADTLKLQGSGLSAQNLLLSQNGPNLEITFAGVANTKAILANFSLENLDNLSKATGASNLANLLFNNQSTPQDSLDVFDATATSNSLFNRNSVTFLNDRNNTLNGFDNSNDVINAQAGNDQIDGRSGNDLLRGGTGADRLTGSSGNDILAGDAANDTLLGGSGVDQFLYNTNAPFTTAAVGQDNINDFSRANAAGGDVIVLDKTSFTTLSSAAGGSLQAAEFASVSSDFQAGSVSDDIVYSRATDRLFYNQNGADMGFGSGGQFATLTGISNLAGTEFLVVA